MEKEDGVWRTIRGRRIFIASGQSLGEAMKKSGKFNKREDIRKGKGDAVSQDFVNRMSGKYSPGKMKKLEKTRRRLMEPIRENYYNQAPKNRIYEFDTSHLKAKTRVERNMPRYSEAQQRELRHEELQKKLADYRNRRLEDGKEIYDTFKQMNDREAKNFLRENPKAKQKMEEYTKSQNAKRIEGFKAKKQSNNKIENVKREISYIGQDGKEHKMNEYKYPGEKYENWLKNKYGTDKEEEIIAKDRNKSYSRLRDEYYYENDTTPKKEMQELKRQTEQSNNKVDNYNKILEKMKKNNPDIDNYLEKNKDNKYHLTDEGKVVGEKELYQEYRNEMLSDMYDADTTYEDWKNGIVDGKNSNVKTFEELSDRDVKDLFKQLNDEGSDFSFDDDVKIEDGKIKTSVGVFMPDDRGYTERDVEIPIDKNETYASLEEKVRDWQSRHSSPDSFYDDDFDQKDANNYSLNPKQRKEDMEHDLKWFREMHDKYQKGEKSLKKDDDYQSLKKQYASEFGHENDGRKEDLIKKSQETIKAFKKKKQSNNLKFPEKYIKIGLNNKKKKGK